MRLIDIYGDSIKMVSPELFDFNRIEWLDVDNMLKEIELEYNRIQEKCGFLITRISDSFRTSLQNSMNAYKSTASSNKTLGLAMAGLGMRTSMFCRWSFISTSMDLICLSKA